ncbi:unnamed protein product [Danaus chrysippus]|uniref:(African queen) hypothetical protein n=1 Tax=Danaus chrysippus TaxID=151541 RepID=A0A8J2RHK4_9NEOP|nr:unnamed protein product [Danaus chrysippus]
MCTPVNTINFTVNGEKYSVGGEVSSCTTLLDYLRRYLELRGTKYMCLEGGCGACIVNVTKKPGEPSQSVNSCMVLITSCADWDINTIEKVGNRKDGYHVLQKALADNNGTQCGYCSPGWIMAMYSILKNRRPTMLQVEQSFGSNICRCTGYRPILETFKRFSSDSDNPINILDIEDLKLETCSSSGSICSQRRCDEFEWCMVSKNHIYNDILHIKLKDNRDWYNAEDTDDVFAIWNKKGTDSYMLIAGNTGKGVYPILEYPKVLININEITELRKYYLDQNLVIGSSTTLTEFMNIMEVESSTENFSYLKILYDHLKSVANISIRNIMPRSQNAHAFINAGFLYKLNKTETVIECRIVYGGLSPTYNRSIRTEKYMIGKEPFKNDTLQGALAILSNEIEVTENLPMPPAAYRRQTALALFYKGLLSLCPPSKLHPRYISGAIKIHETRKVSEAQFVYDTDPSMWPLTKPISRLNGLVQCAGETKYVDDLQQQPGEVFAAFVLSTVALGTIVNIDASKALKEPGVIAFYKASDIPGRNSFVPAVNVFNTTDEEFLCNGEVKYYNQPLGIIVATSQCIAEKAVTLVSVTYKNMKKPVIDVGVAKREPARVTSFRTQEATTKGNDVSKLIKGEQSIYTQYHFSIETLVCVTLPTEDGLSVHTSTQWIDSVHVVISRALLIDQNRIKVQASHLGGSYGIKISRINQVALACSFVAYKQNRPCRFIQNLNTNMRAVGKRLPCSTTFEAGVSKNGVIQYVDYNFYSDNGYIINEPLIMLGTGIFNNVYKLDSWTYKASNVVTDTPSNTWCRSPGSLEHIAMAEHLIERISYEMNLNPLDVRMANIDRNKHGDIVDMIDNIKDKSQYEVRKIEISTFNSQNRWKKRGLGLSLLRWETVGSQYLEVNMCAYSDDGTVAFSHGGIEMGQGINTKAAQVCAYFLNISVEKVRVQPNDSFVSPNCFASGGSFTSENIVIGIRKCCDQLLERLEPIRNQMVNPTWEQLIKKAHQMDVDLQVHAIVTKKDIKTYTLYGVTLAEVEIDVLTGEWEIKRVDLCEDVGRSVNPELDRGQVEGAFTLGVGYNTCEQILNDPNTGEVLTNRTWNYWVPCATDIPQDMRIYFRKRSFSYETILGSKATGEPATCMGVAVPFAMRAAVVASRQDSGKPYNEWFQIGNQNNYFCYSYSSNQQRYVKLLYKVDK